MTVQFPLRWTQQSIMNLLVCSRSGSVTNLNFKQSTIGNQRSSQTLSRSLGSSLHHPKPKMEISFLPWISLFHHVSFSIMVQVLNSYQTGTTLEPHAKPLAHEDSSMYYYANAPLMQLSWRKGVIWISDLNYNCYHYFHLTKSYFENFGTIIFGMLALTWY